MLSTSSSSVSRRDSHTRWRALPFLLFLVCPLLSLLRRREAPDLGSSHLCECTHFWLFVCADFFRSPISELFEGQWQWKVRHRGHEDALLRPRCLRPTNRVARPQPTPNNAVIAVNALFCLIGTHRLQNRSCSFQFSNRRNGKLAKTLTSRWFSAPWWWSNSSTCLGSRTQGSAS